MADVVTVPRPVKVLVRCGGSRRDPHCRRNLLDVGAIGDRHPTITARPGVDGGSVQPGRGFAHTIEVRCRCGAFWRVAERRLVAAYGAAMEAGRRRLTLGDDV